jgi:hypothetical protein
MHERSILRYALVAITVLKSNLNDANTNRKVALLGSTFTYVLVYYISSIVPCIAQKHFD